MSNAVFTQTNLLIAPFVLQGRMTARDEWQTGLEPVTDTLFCLGDVAGSYQEGKPLLAIIRLAWVSIKTLD